MYNSCNSSESFKSIYREILGLMKLEKGELYFNKSYHGELRRMGRNGVTNHFSENITEWSEQSTYVEKSLLQESAEESHYILKSRKYTNFLLKYKQKLGKPLEA